MTHFLLRYFQHCDPYHVILAWSIGIHNRRRVRILSVQPAPQAYYIALGGEPVLLNKIRLVAVVGGNEVTHPFMVTEVYVQQSGTWKLASLSFTRLVTQ